MADALDRLLELAILTHEPRCPIRQLADYMNQLGCQGCREHREEVLRRIAEVYGQREDLNQILDRAIAQAEAKGGRPAA